MKRSTIVANIVIALAFTAGCEKSNEVEPKPAPEAEAADDSLEDDDKRPPAGRNVPVGYDLTELARHQNRVGNEPPMPTRKGEVKTATKHPNVTKTGTGFVAHLPDANNIPTPAYYRGRVLTGGFGTHELHSLDPRTGKPDWSLELSDDGPTAPACKDGDCVFNTYSCTIFSVAADTGKHKWSWWLGSPQLATPVIFGNKVYTSFPGEGAPDGAPFVIAALDLKTGEPLWQRWIDAEVNSTPVAYRGKLYVATQVGTLYEFSAEDGKILDVRHNRVASPPTISPDGTFFPRERLPNENDMLASAFPVMPELEAQIPVMPQQVTPRPRPLVAAHRLVTVEEGVVVATNAKTGDRLWQRRLEDGAASVSAPLLYAGGSVLLATAQGKVTRIHQDTGDVMTTYDLGAGTLASQPIVHDGWIYAGTTAGAVVGYDTGDSELTGWDMLGGGPDRLNVGAVEVL